MRNNVSVVCINRKPNFFLARFISLFLFYNGIAHEVLIITIKLYCELKKNNTLKKEKINLYVNGGSYSICWDVFPITIIKKCFIKCNFKSCIPTVSVYMTRNYVLYLALNRNSHCLYTQP